MVFMKTRGGGLREKKDIDSRKSENNSSSEILERGNENGKVSKPKEVPDEMWMSVWPRPRGSLGEWQRKEPEARSELSGSECKDRAKRDGNRV